MRWELGAIGHGPTAIVLTEYLCDEIRAWAPKRDQRKPTLPVAVASAAFEFINGPLLDNPHRVGRRLPAPLDDRYSTRRGSYRIIYRIDDKTRMVTVVDVDHRGSVYKPH